MDFTTGQRDVGEEASVLCTIPPSGVRVRNLGNSRIFVGGPDVGPEHGYPIEPGTSEDFAAPVQHEAPVVPAPPGDMAPVTLYAATGKGNGPGKAALIAVS